MILNDLKLSVENNDVDKALGIIAELAKSKNQEAVPLLIQYLINTDNNTLRNEIAIALSDIGSSEAVEPIIELIRSDKTIGNKGTLLYALQAFNYSHYIELLVDLLSDDNFEVSRQSLILIENLIEHIPDEIKNKCILKIRNKINNYGEKIDFLSESLEIFMKIKT